MPVRLSPQKARLKQVNRAYEIAHGQLHADYMKVYTAKLKQHKLLHHGPADHFNHPVEFHEDEDLIEAQRTLVAGLTMAKEAHRTSARTLKPNRGRR